MFAKVAVDVSVTPGAVTFRFPTPVSVIMLFVSQAEGEPVWHVMASGMRSMPAEMETVTFMPLAEAPVELVELVRRSEEDVLARLQAGRGSKPLISTITYGIAPDGLQEFVPAAELVAGDYELSVITDQGEGTARFHVPAA